MNKTNKIKIPEEDFDFIQKQQPSVIKLWLQCWRCDPYGSSWKILEHDLRKTSFQKAKKILWDEGLFAFKVDRSPYDCRKVVNWQVLNLHGSRSSRRNNYWMKYITDTGSNQDLGETDQVS